MFAAIAHIPLGRLANVILLPDLSPERRVFTLVILFGGLGARLRAPRFFSFVYGIRASFGNKVARVYHEIMVIVGRDKQQPFKTNVFLATPAKRKNRGQRDGRQSYVFGFRGRAGPSDNRLQTIIGGQSIQVMIAAIA